MKTFRKWGALALTVMIATFSLAGCGAENDTTADSSANSTSTSAESTTAGDTTTSDDSAYTVGVITAVGSAQITIELYESDESISYLSDISADSLDATGETTTISFSDDTVVETYDNGVTTTTTTSALAIGDLVAVSDDGGQTITIVYTDETSTSSDTTESSESSDSTESTSEDTVVIAE